MASGYNFYSYNGDGMTNREFIINRIRQLTTREYVPKFKVGDTIFNPEYKIASLVTSMEKGLLPGSTKEVWYYVTKDVYNPSKNVHNMKYTNSKVSYRVDMYYHKVNPNSIEILFGGK